ncbi:unnamed protein product [Linum tenue]|uniref:Uncharacterized protein n=1 Tax=Linum tenue TaxID=586396 RepID=A0AAV0RU18_9ROSI|nr:unnamed protein product [Linum tenue]
MATTSNDSASSERLAELKTFDETKAGGRSQKLPRIFHTPPRLLDNRPAVSSEDPDFIFPVIDLEGVLDPNKRTWIVKNIRDASGKWGFFQVVNHGVPAIVMKEMQAGIRKFYEQDVELEKEFFGCDPTKKVVYNSNFDLYNAPAANWRDSTLYHMAPDPPALVEFSACCREIPTEYSKEMKKFGDLLFQLLSEALGLRSDHLREIGCVEGMVMGCHYYPACPQPKLTIGLGKHSDLDFATILLQDHIGGLEVLHWNQWVDVPYSFGGLVINIGDLLQASSLFSYFVVVES